MQQQPVKGRPLRVLRVAHHGVVSAWRERERELRRRGVDVTLVSANRWNEGGKDVELDAGGDAFVVGVDTVGFHPNGFLYDPRPLWRLLGQPWDLIDLHEEPCAAATAEILALMRLRRVAVPYVLYSAQNIAKRYPPPIRSKEKAALRGAAGAYVCNTEAGLILQRKGLRTPASLIGLGVDLSVFRPRDRTEPHTPLVLGYSGRLETYKGVDILLRAMALLPDARLLIAGEGPERMALTTLADELGIADRVHFLGHLGSDLPAFYRDLDALVVPSLPTPGWLEQFGRVVVEAMASGIPVVASRSGALPDVVADAGLLVQPRRAEEIAEAVNSLTDPARWRQLRAAGLVQCQQYSWEAIGERHRSFYDAVLSPTEAKPQVVVVAYGSPEPLRAALAPLRGLSVTVVDNSSLAETRQLVEEHGGHYLDAGANIGFGAAVNLALTSLDERGLGRSDVLLLNPDASISAAGVDELAKALHAQMGTACIAPSQTDPSGARVERVEWPFPSPLAAWLVALGLGRLERRRGFVIGSILLLNRLALDDVGRFDERFFLYAEETDWQKRAVDRGWRIGYAPTVRGTHVGGGTSSDEHVRSELFHTSQLVYMRKHFGAAGALIARMAMVAGSLVRVIVGKGEVRDSARWRLCFYLSTPHAAARPRKVPKA